MRVLKITMWVNLSAGVLLTLNPQRQRPLTGPQGRHPLCSDPEQGLVGPVSSPDESPPASGRGELSTPLLPSSPPRADTTGGRLLHCGHVRSSQKQSRGVADGPTESRRRAGDTAGLGAWALRGAGLLSKGPSQNHRHRQEPRPPRRGAGPGPLQRTLFG